MRSLLVGLIVGLGLGLPRVAASSPPIDDATLHAVQFVDQREGWAVGDQGVIWHTIDAGKTWERQASGTQASLRGICFLTPYQGYIVGRTELPNRVGSAGVILTTSDGGVTWKELTSTTLPGLQVVKFFDEKNGLVAGDCTDLMPEGVFHTTNGGQTWKAPEPGMNIRTTWTRFVEGNASKFVLQSGETDFGVFVDGSLNCHHPNAFASGNAKPSWKAPAKPDNGLIHASCFVDEKLGWAVGDLGQIHHTSNGGKSWTPQKSGGQRVALLAVHAQSANVPFALLGYCSGKQGYLSAAITTQERDEARLSAAVRQVGGNFARVLPVPAHLHGLYAHEPVATDMPAMLPMALDEPTVERLVRCLQQFKPEVITCDSGATLAERFLLLHIKEAIKRASQAEGGHVVKKVYAVNPDAGEITLDLTLFHPELGACLLDHCEAARHLFSYQPCSNRLRLQLIQSTIPSAEKHQSVFEGIELAPGGTARRAAREAHEAIQANLADREALCKQRREIEALFQEPITRDRTEATLVKCLESLQKLPEYAVPTVAVDLGFRFVQAGQWTAARELFAGVVEHHAVHPDAVEAMRWLVKYQASGEVRRRLERGDFPIFQKAAFTPIEANPIKTVSTLEELLPKPALKFINSEALRQWNQASLDLQPKLAAFGTMYTLDPDTLFPSQVVRRNLGLHGRALGLFQQLAPQPSTYIPLHARLMAERDILDNKPIGTVEKTNPGQIPYVVMPQANGTFTKTKPVLDGVLNDDCWKDATAITVEMPTLKGYPTEARFRHDEQFLYVALSCDHPEKAIGEKVARKGYDADLRGRDRVQLLLDVDRDYTTTYRLCVDERGLVAEDCWGDPSWNPKWFVAHQATPTRWIVEMAIPFTELTDTVPTSKSRWGMNIVRMLPGIGQHNWGEKFNTAPTSRSMGLLNFGSP